MMSKYVCICFVSLCVVYPALYPAFFLQFSSLLFREVAWPRHRIIHGFGCRPGCSR